MLLMSSAGVSRAKGSWANGLEIAEDTGTGRDCHSRTEMHALPPRSARRHRDAA
jgi:hypothetical protein